MQLSRDCSTATGVPKEWSESGSAEVALPYKFAPKILHFEYIQTCKLFT